MFNLLGRQKKSPVNKISPLAHVLAIKSSHSPQRIEDVLSYFPDTTKKRFSIERQGLAFAHVLMQQNEKGTAKIFNKLKTIVKDIHDARRFNEKYLGHMLSTPCIPAIWANTMASVINSNTVAREVSIAESDLEREALSGLMDIVGLDTDRASGTFTSGGSMANTTALTVARILMNNDMKSSKKSKKAVIFTSPFAHYSLDKSISLLGGIGGNDIRIIRIPSVGFKMSVEHLEKEILKAKSKNVPILGIFAIAGETETGLVDDLSSISKIADTYSLRLITDGAYGAPYRISRNGNIFDGMEKSFAITLDPHKTLYTPYSNGAVLFRDSNDHAWLTTLLSGNKVSYLQFEGKREKIAANFRNSQGNLGQKRIEGSMGAGPILSTVSVLRTLGINGLRVVYDLTLDRIAYMHDRLERSQLLIPLYNPETNLICFTLRPEVIQAFGIDITTQKGNDMLGRFIDSSRKKLDKDIVGAGGYFFSATDLPLDNHRSIWVYRACIMNPRTTNKIIDDAVEGLEKLIINAL